MIDVHSAYNQPDMVQLSQFSAILLFTFFAIGPVDLFSLLSGTWSMTKSDGSRRLEVWHYVNDTTMAGLGLKVKGQDTFLLENLQLINKTSGYWYIPTVPDQNSGQPVPFELTSSDRHVYVFENIQHDFPQRIQYHFKPVRPCPDPWHRCAGDTLDVRVEDIQGKGISFRFFRQ